MRMVSRKFRGKHLALVIAGLTIGGAAFALSPAFSGIKSVLQGLDNADPDSKCRQYQDPQKKQECDRCAKAVNQQKQKVKKAESAAEAKDAQLESQATSAAKAASAGDTKTERGAMGSAQANNAAGKVAKQGQAQNFGNLAQALNKCKSEIERACQGDMEQVGSDAKQACESAAQQAQAAQAQSAGEAEKMAQDEKKNDQNGQGMQPPQMPQMPQQDKKDSGVASDTATSTPVAASALGGNQLAGQGISLGADEKKTDTTTASTGYGGRSYGASGISSSSDPSFGGAGNFDAGSGMRGSSGASLMGAGFGGGGSGNEANGGAAQAASAAVPQKQEDIEAFSNGGARPSYLGMKSKGGELTDLGLDTGAGGSSPLADSADGERSLASTEQGAGIRGEDESGGSIFNMIHTRLEEIGRRGSI